MRWISVLGAILFLIGLPGLVITSIPNKLFSQEIPIIREGYEVGTLEIFTPVSLHAGDVSHINLSVNYDSAKVAAMGVDSLELISRLDMPAVIISPFGEGRVKIDPRYQAFFSWQVTPENVDFYKGRVWLFEEESNGDRYLLLSREIEFTTENVFGFSYPIARTISIAVMFIGLGMMVVSQYLVFRTKRGHN